jgi:hypothetical protein
MNVTLVINVFLIVLTLFFASKILKLSGRTKENKKMLKILDSFDDRDTFFSSADEFISTEKNQEFVNKVAVLRLWGDAYYERDEEFRTHLQEVNIDGLLNPDGKNRGYEMNEDSFFYLYLAIPNRLYYRKRDDLRALLCQRMEAYDGINENALLRQIALENRKFYDRKDDFGKRFINSLLEGEYGGFKYSKQLIGLYKHCEEGILAVILKEEGDEEGCEECMNNLSDFAKNTRLGKRWTKELGIELKDEETAEDGEAASDSGAEAMIEAPKEDAEKDEQA